MAERLPTDYYHPVTSFSRAIMGAHAVTVAVELHAGGESVRQAAAADATTIPSRPRRARHRIEEARGYQLDGQPDVALATLEKAHAAAPETIKYNGYAKRIVLGGDGVEGPGPSRAGLRTRGEDRPVGRLRQGHRSVPLLPPMRSYGRGMDADSGPSGALQEATEIPLPPIGELSQRQQRGQDCVWCGVTLVAGAVVDLGPRKLRRGDWRTSWFPRACSKHPRGVQAAGEERASCPG